MRSTDIIQPPKKALSNQLFIISPNNKYDSSEFYSKPNYLDSWRHMIYYKYLNYSDVFKNTNP